MNSSEKATGDSFPGTGMKPEKSKGAMHTAR